MIEADYAALVGQDEGGCGAGSVALEVLFIHGDGEGAEELLADLLDVGCLLRGRGIGTAFHVAIVLCGAYDRQVGKLLLQASHHGRVTAAIGTPVGPEEEKDWLSGSRRGSGA